MHTNLDIPECMILMLVEPVRFVFFCKVPARLKMHTVFFIRVVQLLFIKNIRKRHHHRMFCKFLLRQQGNIICHCIFLYHILYKLFLLLRERGDPDSVCSRDIIAVEQTLKQLVIHRIQRQR